MSISNVSSASNSIAMYQERLAQMQAQKQASQVPATAPASKPAPATVATVDVDHDGDSR